MKKVLNIALKDLKITFHDRAAWILMLAAPLLLTLGLGAVTGAFSGNTSSGIQDIPLVIVNQDEGPLGEYVAAAFAAEEMGGFFLPTPSSDAAAARRQVEDDQVAAAVLIPSGFSAGILPDMQTGQPGPAAPVEVYANPARPISAGVVQSVAAEAVHQIEAGPMSGQVAIRQLLTSGRLAPNQVQAYAGEMAGRIGAGSQSGPRITLQLSPDSVSADPVETNPLAYLAPAMAVFFLMYTVTQGGRSILAERDHGTLGRLLATPTSRTQVLAGKVLGIFITGMLQVSLLVIASSMLFQLNWGSPLAVGLLIAAVSAAATGWGILLAAIAKTPFQVTSVGSALMLFFGLLGGSFIPVEDFSGVFRWLSRITPNAWALDGFTILSSRGELSDLSSTLGALALMAGALFLLALLFSRKGFAR